LLQSASACASIPRPHSPCSLPRKGAGQGSLPLPQWPHGAVVWGVQALNTASVRAWRCASHALPVCPCPPRAKTCTCPKVLLPPHAQHICACSCYPHPSIVLPRLAALGIPGYLSIGWNAFDCLITLLSIMGVLLGKWVTNMRCLMPAMPSARVAVPACAAFPSPYP